ncbi:MAG: type II toxin-antitoxin system mRNA interferase toxin, RelE/StbE family [Candidatus Buchananbacteria bacterium CG10_big_fil_rev_8_21_14_0_10_42_9]|uniref:Type II toxin-antitoxin system mRNA interferase toxin, RelE/StbE family n=1 Tax=Candidatus Buchananbacteria bacterium CG10_big_fil_rev_8_21_14_0_10_42_9 TaxID=1974526 RepID=A0A2H0W0X9_9BACT|nr:MAG: type II toxin-antitoxin system mRNA interferase toxin, RelE/StbE family [Candidatus Buchananbacteria bacterium CG10_big_fil_rev_8_21_14_0_10_42_9]
MNERVFYTRSALKDLALLDKNIARRIIDKLSWFSDQKNPLRFAKRLKQPFNDLYRFRIGDYRVIFELGKKQEYKILIILRIKYRRDVYG